MVVIDTDILLIEFRYQRDLKYRTNNQFLSTMKVHGAGVTIYTIIEFLGSISFNVNATKLAAWRSWLRDAYNLTIIWPETRGLDADSFAHSVLFERPFERMCRTPIAFVDSLISDLVEQVDRVDAFITWNAKHFIGKTSLAVKTPEEYLASAGTSS